MLASPPASALTSSPSSFSRPRPRPPRSIAAAARIRVQNRRREYLERNPSYFESSEHELAAPLLYDSLIRRFQSPAEREAEARAKGYARVLEGSLMRGEERLAQLAAQYPVGEGALHNGTAREQSASLSYDGDNKEEAHEQWKEYWRDRFIRGDDEDFDYSRVDNDDVYDTLERREEEDAWFDEETPRWASDEQDLAEDDDINGGNGKRQVERILEGETGIQDF
ncbi:putative coiled-coil domain-protein [Diplogelasinospora grovesii]|uniref:Coiled-coil domain-protein n=1 Tax=Diplogelasinospora grovesii TaxID=303347 RepID=A0AAN6NF51_9PEZI|nr:putative coiled-coil domain-protein [Diplogelasinospora grovesii]